MNDIDIPSHVWDEAAVVVNEEEGVKHFRMDVLWAHMQAVRSTDGKLKFPSWRMLHFYYSLCHIRMLLKSACSAW